MIKKRDKFFSNQFSFALVIRGNVESIEDIKRYVAEHGDVKIVYQLISTSRLWIKEGGDTHE